MKEPKFEELAKAFIDASARALVELRHEDFEAGYIEGFEHGSKREIVMLTPAEIKTLAAGNLLMIRSTNPRASFESFAKAVQDSIIAKNQPN